MLHDGAIMIRTGPTLTPVANIPDEMARKEFAGLDQSCAMRCGRRCERSFKTTVTRRCSMRAAQLNFHYDHFISRFGAINDRR